MRRFPRWLAFSSCHQSSSPGVIGHCPEDWLRTEDSWSGTKIINTCHSLPTPKTPKTHCRWNHAPKNTRIRRGVSECVVSASVTRGALQRCEAIDPGARRTCGSISASGWPRGDQTGAPTIMCRAWVTRAAGDRPLSDEDPKLKGKAGTGRMWSWSAYRRKAELAKCERTVDVTCLLSGKAKTPRIRSSRDFGASSQTATAPLSTAARLRVNGAKVCSDSAFWMSIASVKMVQRSGELTDDGVQDVVWVLHCSPERDVLL